MTPYYVKVSVGCTELIYGPSVFFAKLSICILYLRLFAPNQGFRFLTYFIITANLLIYAATTFTYGYLCIPRPSQSWRQRQSMHVCLDSSKPVNYIGGIYNIVSDLYIFILPLPVIWRLHMPLNKRIGVSSIFAVASLWVLIENAILISWLTLN